MMAKRVAVSIEPNVVDNSIVELKVSAAWFDVKGEEHSTTETRSFRRDDSEALLGRLFDEAAREVRRSRNL
jgi:hypothetical protein